jgi:hypothetical protein
MLELVGGARGDTHLHASSRQPTPGRHAELLATKLPAGWYDGENRGARRAKHAESHAAERD